MRPLHDIYHVPVDDRFLVFSPLRQVAAVVNQKGMSTVKRMLRGCGEKLGVGGLTELAELLKLPCLEPPIAEGPAKPPFLGLILTRGCNMACRYCDFDSAGNCEVMSKELVGRALKGYANWIHQAGATQMNLQFFGGEPFTQPALIKLATYKALYLAQKQGVSLSVEACTNGVLDKHMRQFVIDHFSGLVVSFDGQEAEHDRHRPLHGGKGSFGCVMKTLEALSGSSVELCLRVCVSDASVQKMTSFATWLARNIRPHSVTFEAMKATTEALQAGLNPPEPLTFARGFLDAWRILRKVGIECVYASLLSEPVHSFCPVGRDTFIISPDGSIRSCYLRKAVWEGVGVDMRIGQISEEGVLLIEHASVQKLRTAVASRKRCGRCFCKWGCAGGCLVTETPPGHDIAYTAYCRQTRLIQACVLLESLGLSDATDRLLSDKDAVARLWEFKDDQLGEIASA